MRTFGFFLLMLDAIKYFAIVLFIFPVIIQMNFRLKLYIKYSREGNLAAEHIALKRKSSIPKIKEERILECDYVF